MHEKQDWSITQQVVVAKPEDLNATYRMENISIALQMFPRRPKQDSQFMEEMAPFYDASEMQDTTNSASTTTTSDSYSSKSDSYSSKSSMVSLSDVSGEYTRMP